MPSGPSSSSSAERITRITATYGALIHEQVELTRRFLAREEPDLASGDGSLVEEAIRLVLRGAEWLELPDLADAVSALREGIAQIGQVKVSDRSGVVAACHVHLESEERLAGRLRSEGLGTLLEQADLVEDAIEGMRSEAPARSQSPRSLFEDGAPGLGPHGNLLALTVEIKSAVTNQNERIGAIQDMAEGVLQTLLATMSDWENGRKPQILPPAGSKGDAAEEHSLAVYRGLQKSESELRTLVYEVSRLLGTQYSLERRARDLDEHLLWEFLDPLDRFVDDLFEAVARRKGQPALLTVQTGGVGFEPEIGSTLIPILSRLLESGTVRPDATGGAPEIRMAAVRESLEAMIAISGFAGFDPETLSMLERALEDLAGFVEMIEGDDTIALRIQFPMARALRSFLIVEAGGQRIALPWSAVDRVEATGEGPDAGGIDPELPEVRLDALFPAPASMRRGTGAPGDSEAASSGRPVALLRSGGRSTRVTFDRIVWRESARWAPLPSELRTGDDVLGGIIGPDGGITLVLSPAALADRARRTPEVAA